MTKAWQQTLTRWQSDMRKLDGNLILDRSRNHHQVLRFIPDDPALLKDKKFIPACRVPLWKDVKENRPSRDQQRGSR